jgi:Zn-dependent peptidase ImmA (M78 family)/DNA-binding XRE family transcriptional regulator
MDVRESLSEKLQSARKLAGLSTRAVAEKLATRFSISHATVANYESGKSSPPMDMLAALADLYDRPINWFLERGKSLTGVRYRNLKSRVKERELHRFEADVQRWVDAYVAVETRLKRPLLSSIKETRFSSTIDADDLSREVRRMLQIPEGDAIPSVVEVLEKFRVRVLEQPTGLRIDGLAAKYGDEYVVVLNPTVSNDRGRLNAAHELAHVLFGDCDHDGQESKETERRAFDFASHFLLPNNQLKKAFIGKSMVRLVQFKERFGISMAAMVYRADKLGFITKSEAKWLWIEFARRGWKSNEPGLVRPDRATRFEQLIDELLVGGRMSFKEVADLAGVRPDAIRERLNIAMGIQGSNGHEDDGPETIPFPQ